jgi:hypothetical protein
VVGFASPTVAPTTKFWLAVGTRENWHTAFDYAGIWGLKASQRHYWEALAENADIVFFYVTSPVSGVVGYGLVRNKLHQTTPLWPEERARNELIWPLRFEFDVMAALPHDVWLEQKVDEPDLKRRVRSGFQGLEPSLANNLMRLLPGSRPQGMVLDYPVGLRARPVRIAFPEPALATADQHTRAKQLLLETGRLQNLVADEEFPLENRRVDVVWRRVQRAVPSYVFEVQVGGNLTEAMGKLKHAFEMWNSRVFVVGKQEHRGSVNQLLGGTFRELQQRLGFVELAQVEELYQRKRAYRELESQLGILP